MLGGSFNGLSHQAPSEAKWKQTSNYISELDWTLYSLVLLLLYFDTQYTSIYMLHQFVTPFKYN